MKFEKTPIKSKGNAVDMSNKAVFMELKRVSTLAIVLFLVRRHKFGLITTWAVVMTIVWLFPAFFSELGALIGLIK